MRHQATGVVALVFALFAVAAASGARAQDLAELPNPFARFDSYRLPNGLKVWYGQLPGASMTSMAVIVPAGWDQDSPGREQTAHLLEHVLLSDRHGRTEGELVRELTGRGGSHTGVTTPDRTYYQLHIGTDQAAYGIEWLHDVVAPRPLAETLVETNREPVAIEIGAGRRRWFERMAYRGLFLPSLRPEPFWLREFGLRTAHTGSYDPYSTLTAIDALDLTSFYNTFYTTSEMLLVIVTGAPRQALQAAIDSTFGLLPWRPAQERARPRDLPERGSRRFTWTLRRSTQLELMYRIPDLNGRDQVRLIFMEDLLRHRLMEKLRRGTDKFVYGIEATTELRGPAAYLGIKAQIDPRYERRARTIIDEELERIRSAATDTAAFYADRDALGRRLRVQNAAPATLVSWATGRFYRPDLHAEFPDLGEYYATVGPDSIAALARRLIVAENRILRVARASPLPVAWLIGMIALAAAAAVGLYRVMVLKHADMSRIRYVTRLRGTRTSRLVEAGLAAIAVLVCARLGYAAAELAAESLVLTVDSVMLHTSALALAVFGAALAAEAAAGMVPRKVLIFEHELRIKSMTYRSTIIPASDILQSRLVGRSHASGYDSLNRPQKLRLFGGDAVILHLADGSVRILPTRRADVLQAAVLAMMSRSAPA